MLRSAEVISALPFEFAVRVVEHPELERRHEVFHHFPTDKAVAFIHRARPLRPVGRAGTQDPR